MVTRLSRCLTEGARLFSVMKGALRIHLSKIYMIQFQMERDRILY